jgi:BirA family biotin operon repressor/biotin-[acetyl-CoA-carboxylase] ligase
MEFNMNPLYEADIRHHIHALNPFIQFDIFDTIDSTNRFLKNQPVRENIHVCCAETQTQGRGRFGRTWHSPFGENIYFSARFRLDCDLALLSGLSLITSLAVINTLNELGLNDSLVIKWPNDILWQSRKLSGCLIELITAANHVEVIIGIGINVNSNTQAHPPPDKPWCSLFDISGEFQNRNRIIGRLIEHLHQQLQRLITSGLTPFLDQWQQVDALYGKLITVSTQGSKISGRANGIDDAGRLILVDGENHAHYLSSGEASISI